MLQQISVHPIPDIQSSFLVTSQYKRYSHIDLITVTSNLNDCGFLRLWSEKIICLRLFTWNTSHLLKISKSSRVTSNTLWFPNSTFIWSDSQDEPPVSSYCRPFVIASVQNRYWIPSDGNDLHVPSNQAVICNAQLIINTFFGCINNGL
mgnify:CR=1 FL=1